jgi:glycosyltransferase involved in cell wall biosynthesis/tetratricopeptide (TPR) repeat protein
MSLQYLFGPVNASFAREHLDRARAGGECLTFGPGPGVDLVTGPEIASWDQLCARLPAGWRPDFVALRLAYATVPPWLWLAPVPLVGWAGDWNLLYHGYRLLLPRCDVVVTDGPGVTAFTRAGIGGARPGNLYGCGDSFLQPSSSEGEGKRDIDILFVGNLHPAVQRERMPWLGRLARLGRRWRVEIRDQVFGDEYRALLRRARVVFNRSIRGECNQRVFECLASGALLFQERGNAEVAALFGDTPGCVFYEDDLETLLERYLTDEAVRKELAEAGFVRGIVHGLESDWNEIVARSRNRTMPVERDDLLGVLGSEEVASDPGLDAELERWAGTADAEGLNALGVLRGRRAREHGRLTVETLERSRGYFDRAVERSPTHLMAGLNRMETLTTLGAKDAAVRAGRHLLHVLDRGDVDPATWNAPRLPDEFDYFRVEWERAGWEGVGNPTVERAAKMLLLRWRLHTLLAELTGDLGYYYEAALTRPDLPVTQAALGCALGRAGKAGDGVPHLRQAVQGNPFDLAAARALFHALSEIGDTEAAQALAEERRVLAIAAPGAVPAEPVFAAPMQPSPSRGMSITWEGPHLARTSVGLINREVCRRLLERGHRLTLMLAGPPEEEVEDSFVVQELRRHFRQKPSESADVHVRHLYPPDWSSPPSGHWVVMQPWEFGSPPREWVATLTEWVDELWTPSAFVRDSFIRAGVPAELVQVVYPGVDTGLFRPGSPPLPLTTRKRFRFLFVGGTIARKGFDLLLAAYVRTFRREDDVCLVVKDLGVSTCYRGQTMQEEIARLQNIPNAPEIEYLDHGLSAEEMARLYAACHCLVLPYRGEGFALPVVEAMACGLPVIVTAYGPATEYCDERSAYPIPARLLRLPESRMGGLETVERPWLAEPIPEELTAALRRVFENPEDGRARGQAGRARVEASLTWDRTAAVVEERLRVLAARPVRRFQGRAVPVDARGGKSRCRVSLCMIVKNEEHNLPACLGSVVGLFDEMIVVDTGSSDRTRELADRAGARVFDFPWVDSFAAARNESLRHATGDWVFWMDADDRLDPENRERLRALLTGLQEENAAFVMKCLCVPREGSGAATVVDHVRLFRRDPQLRWRYRVHEQILMALRERKTDVRWADVVIHHVGYQDPSRREGKLRRDLRLLHLENRDRPDDPFTLFNLGWTYQEAGQLTEALPYLRRSLERSHPSDSIVRKLYALIATCHARLGQREQALAACREGRVHYPDDAELLFEEGALRESDDLAGAEHCYRALLESRPGAHFASVDPALRGHRTRHRLAAVCHQQGKAAEAERLWREITQSQEDFVPAWLGLGELFLEQQRWPELDGVIGTLERVPEGLGEATILQARSHAEHAEYATARSLLEGVIRTAPSALWPRLLLARVLLREGKDLDAAERALGAVLALDGDNVEARNNLERLPLLKG